MAMNIIPRLVLDDAWPRPYLAQLYSLNNVQGCDHARRSLLLIILDPWIATTMNQRSSSATALRRLMTEYKQLTSGGPNCRCLTNEFHWLSMLQVHQTECSQRVHPAFLLFCWWPDSRFDVLFVFFERADIRIRFFYLGGPDLRSQRHALRKIRLVYWSNRLNNTN